MSDMAIRSTQPTRPALAAGATHAAKPQATLHDQIGTGFSPFFRDNDRVAVPARGTAHASITFAQRWQKLDNAEKFFVGLHGTLGTAAIATCAVAGAKGGFRGAGIKGALVGAGIGAASAIGAALVMDVAFTHGSMVTTKAVAKLAGLTK